MATFAFSSLVMEDAHSAQHHYRTTISSELLSEDTIEQHGLDSDDLVEEGGPAPAKRVFNAWVQDLDDQTLPSMDNDELRILHALLFGNGDDAFSVADELLKQRTGSPTA